jgi:hypothetical protein
VFGHLRTATCALGLLCLFGCGSGAEPAQDGPDDQVRGAVSAYLRMLEGGQWTRACRAMTRRARRELEGVTGASCARALAKGVALPRDELAAVGRQVPGARVRVDGATATVGPFEGLGRPLRLERVEGRWLVAG